jgi:hypothetical protein
MTEPELLAAIQHAFDVGQALPIARLIEHTCEECSDVASTFSGRRWPDIRAEEIDAHSHSLPLFPPVAFRQFLPAYMVRGLRRADESWGPNEVLEFTTYSLLPDEVDGWWRERVDGLPGGQVSVILEFLKQVQLRGKDYLGDPPPQADQYWRSRLTKQEAGEQ